ncbi:thioesterase family protein [Limosilactobacillus alvi]|uniref:acyl-CoA thioesterase n=1 Tax=Limosilactobacillus alvi TaxID=990412 RepID=UPI003083FC1C
MENPAQFYTHQVEYYETDRMGISHHSNYIRWMEESRTRFFAAIGWDYGQLEQTGIISPVVSVNCRYKQSTTFGDQVDIKLTVKHLDRVKLTLGYEMTCEGSLVCLGESEHCFTKDGRLLRIDRELPELYQTLAKFPA